MNNQTYITQTGLEKLRTELSNLKNVRRKQVADRIQEAKDFGDLSENAEYAEAKEEQAFIEGRIQELENILRNATIIKEHTKNGGVDVGNLIKIKEKETGDIREYEIVGSSESDPSLGRISNESPLGRTFLGRKIGEIVEVNVPNGVVRYEIIEIE